MTNFVRLGDVCHTTSGGTPSRSRPEFYGGNIPWVKSGNLNDGIVKTVDESITQAGLAASSAKVFPAGTLLMAMYGATVGKLGILAMDAATNQAVCGIQPDSSLDRDFLFYLLLRRRSELVAKSIGGAQPNISQTIIRDTVVPVLSLAEQRRFVELLQRATAIRRRAEAARTHVRAIVPALFVDTFGDPATNPKDWPVVTVGDLLESASYGTSKKANDRGEGIPILRMGNVTYEGALDTTDLKHIEIDDSEREKAALLAGDILFNRTNSKDLVGKTGLWDGRYEAVAASYFIRLRVNRQYCEPVYLWAFMNSAFMKRVLFATARGAIGQSNINAQELKALRIPKPPLDLQIAFAEQVQRIEALARGLDAAAAKAEAMVAALSAELFEPGKVAESAGAAT
ncbi:MAG: restriction endonuclease subunit S [Pseudolabrys sp.]